VSTARRIWAWTRPSLPATRTLTLAATAGLLAAVLSVLYGIVEVDGDPSTLFVLAAVTVVAATVLARAVRVVVAVGLAVVVLSVGLAWYVISLPYDPQVVAMIDSNLELLSGQSILEIERSTVWALSVTPTPVFVTWYLSLRGWYSSAAAVGAATLGYFVLTGDAAIAQTLLGVTSTAALLGFGDLDRRDGPFDGAEAVAVVLAVMVIAPLAVTVTPAGSAASTTFGGSGGDGGTVEATLLSSDARVDIAGDIELSSEVRYTVTAAESQYWRVSSFDRYTGEGWVRAGGSEPLGERELRYPPGQVRFLEQTFQAESPISTMPAAWRPVGVSGEAANRTRVTAIGGLVPGDPLATDESYRVRSAVPVVTAEGLASAGTDDPPQLADKYTQLPASTPDRIARRTEEITAAASNRYETARTVEQWLRTNREYSLEVDKPDGNVADAFLFEMERGYCTYYATTMVVMLRSQGVPARMTVGYTPGEQVDSNQYVLRGYNSHAWVEVYFPERGWVPFDPTPAGPRVEAEQTEFDRARQNGTAPLYPPDVDRPTPDQDTDEGTDSTPTRPDPADTGNVTTPEAPDGGTTPVGEVSDPGSGSGGGLPELPPREHLALGVVVLAGAVAGVRRSGVGERAYRAVWLRRLPRSDPATDVERAFDRLAYLLERRHRPRRSGETVRQYLAAVGADERAWRVALLRERARYGGEITGTEATEAIDLVGQLRRE